MAVLKTQEIAGLDLITDGELSRFDPSQPETNGMIDYFVDRMAGIQRQFTAAELAHFRHDRGLTPGALPPGMVVGKVNGGTHGFPTASWPPSASICSGHRSDGAAGYSRRAMGKRPVAVSRMRSVSVPRNSARRAA